MRVVCRSDGPYGWTPEYAASMPLDQLIAWAASSSDEISEQEAMRRIQERKEREQRERENE